MSQPMIGNDGKPLTSEEEDLVRDLHRAMMACPRRARGLVLCRFCDACRRYDPPGEPRCRCGDDS